MKRLISAKKILSFITAAMLSMALAAGCSDKKSGSSTASTEENVTTIENSGSGADTAETISNDTPAAAPISMTDLFSDRDLDPGYDSITAEIKLSGTSVEIDGTGASASGSVVTITGEGVYRVTGTLDDGQMIVDSEKKVQIVLDNADITCKASSPIYIINADKTFVTLAENSVNTLTDGSSYTFAEDTLDEPDAALFSSDSLTINGSGTLNVNANYSCGIRSKDDLVITGGTINVTAVGDGLKGKDYVAVADGDITVNSGSDGIKSNNADDESLGFVYIEGGSFDITAGQDGIQAETIVNVLGGEFDITSGGGSSNAAAHTEDFGGFGGGGQMGGGQWNGGQQEGGFGRGGGRRDFSGSDEMSVPDDFDPSQFEGMTPPDGFGDMSLPDDFDPSQFEGMTPPDDFGDMSLPDGFDPSQFEGTTPPGGGNFGEMPGSEGNESSGAEESADGSDSTKGIKAGTALTISYGTFSIDSADDALHSNGDITISGGEFTLNAGDDGLHADSAVNIISGTVTVESSYEGIEAAQINISGGDVSVTSSDDGFNASDGTSQGAMGSYSSGVELNISDGLVYVNASGDGLDSNGDMTISGGTVIVDGPTNDGNGALDSNSEIVVTGGTIIAAGSSGMAEYPGSSSTQNSVSATFDSTLSAGTLVTLLDEDGSEIICFAPAKSFNNIVISSPEIETGKTYTVCTGGTHSGDGDDPYLCYGYNGDGTEAGSFTVSDVTSFIGTQSMMGGGFGGGQMGGNGGGRMGAGRH